MENDTRKYAAKTRGRPFAPGNPGRPRGSRNRTTIVAELLLIGQAEALTRTAITRALEGDGLALKLCLERLIPQRRERPVALDFSAVRSPADIQAGLTQIAAALAAAEITIGEADAAITLLDRLARCFSEAKRAEKMDRALGSFGL